MSFSKLGVRFKPQFNTEIHKNPIHASLNPTPLSHCMVLNGSVRLFMLGG